MKIVVATIALGNYTGCDTWTYAIVNELRKFHEIFVFTFNRGGMYDHVEKIATMIDCVEPDKYDFAICNHLPCFYRMPANLPVIYTSHSPTVKRDSMPNGANFYVAVSEEIREIYKKFEPIVIRNGVDCNRFYPKTKINKQPQNILYLSNPEYSAGFSLVKEAFSDLNVFTVPKPVFDIESYILRADLVVSFGRGAIESMACGRNVICADYRPSYMDVFMGGGLITPQKFENLKLSNFTGRWINNKSFDAISLRNELKKYKVEYANELRKQVVNHCNIKKTAQKYLKIGKILMEEKT